ncbi:alkaline phosphatase family protein [Streptomyces luteolifulvus]|uniref:alkaline phosphatase family protein n=1 Tax=Streptomyces luteolifulvus TaxID=2615112 RepID=UPI001CD94DE1|nr:alkaline phosphatase family protein [Streptomyces luteolifulvus]
MTALLLTTAGCDNSSAQEGIPRPDHIVVVIEENQPFDAVIGSPEAPYLNELARQGASLTQFFAITHPSQPNYLALFSGSTQGVSDNSCPHTLTARNLASQLLQAGLTFVGYAEGLPRVGFTGCSSGAYVRRHNPWVNFTNLPASLNRPWTDFPRDFDELPTISFVVPDLNNDMHDGSVRQADTWLRDNLGDYADWAMKHNSLLVVTWDEDDSEGPNHIPTILAGEHVQRGSNTQPNNLYGLLRTLMDAYELKPLEHSAEADPVDVWAND